MIAEILCIGSELLLGEIINTNAAYISGRLLSQGIDAYYQTSVGDNKRRIKDALDIAFKRSDMVIITGGLGPTDDDITSEAIAEYFNKELIIDKESVYRIENYFRRLKRVMPESNIKQAKLPQGARAMLNPVGTAPGFILELENKSIMAFPGVPEELYAMWDENAENYLKKFSHGSLVIRNLRYFGIAEALLAEKVKDLMEKPNPTVAPLVSKGEVRLRLAAKADTTVKANHALDELEKEILERTSDYFFGYGNETLEEIVGERLLEKNLTLSVAESCTGGLVSSRLTDVSGSSNYIRLNFVTYSNESKIKILGINPEIINNFGAVSSKVAVSMAEGARALTGSDIGLGITGLAGPTGGSEEKPVGLVYIGLCDRHNVEVYEVRIPSGYSRKDIKYRASQYALNYLRLFINKHIIK